MAYRCPACFNPSSLEIRRSIELCSDSRSDEISLQIVSCDGCGFRGAAVYEESRRGALDSEAWEYTGYWMAPDAAQQLEELMISCTAPDDSRCSCVAHQQLGEKDSNGRWRRPEGLGSGETFWLV